MLQFPERMKMWLAMCCATFDLGASWASFRDAFTPAKTREERPGPKRAGEE
jgi:hypothetical protein